jgi:hypothetical protein
MNGADSEIEDRSRRIWEVAMRGKLMFLGGLAAGFVLGTRAGREKYEELKQAAVKIKEHPTVQEATGVVQEQANRLLNEGKDKVSNSKLGERLKASSSDASTAYDDADTDYALTTSPLTATTPTTTTGTTKSGTNY